MRNKKKRKKNEETTKRKEQKEEEEEDEEEAGAKEEDELAVHPSANGGGVRGHTKTLWDPQRRGSHRGKGERGASNLSRSKA